MSVRGVETQDGEREPLLDGRPASSKGGDQQGETRNGSSATNSNTRRWRWRWRWREIALLLWAVGATAAVVVLAALRHQRTEDGGAPGNKDTLPKRNLIFMVSDGMGPSSLSLTRSWLQHIQTGDEIPTSGDNNLTSPLLLDRLLVGQSRTRSTSSLITDSAAGATAFSCGLKSYNGAISVLDDGQPCGSVMEAAKRAGYTTGLVVTTRLTDATPAVWTSHVRSRAMEEEIALQMVGEGHLLGQGRMVDWLMGGGRCVFLPRGVDGGCRSDGRDVVREAERAGWRYIESKDEFDRLGSESENNITLPLLALLASHDFPYEIDRGRFPPSLEAMTATTLRALHAATADSEKGFFVMIEGSRIDHAGHSNDPATQAHEVHAYDRALAAALDFMHTHTSVPTVLVSTSDHETGGLATAHQPPGAPAPEYRWLPDVLANVSRSAHHTAHELRQYLGSHPHDKQHHREFIQTLLSANLGISPVDPDEIAALLSAPRHASRLLAEMVSRRARIGWSTHGHSAADVNVYAHAALGAAAGAGGGDVLAPLRAVRENTEIGVFLREWLGVGDEVEGVTRELREAVGRLGPGELKESEEIDIQ